MRAYTERDGTIARLWLDDAGKKNAMSEALADDFSAAVDALGRLDGVRVIIVAGKNGVFSAGGDLAMLERLTQVSRAEAERFMRGYYQRFLHIRTLGIPLVAAIEGAAIGAGLCLALACDLVLVAEDAKLAFNFSRLGLHPGMGATFFAPRCFGAMRARELLLSGRFFSGREAKDYGAALAAVPATELAANATALAQSIAAAAPQTNRILLAELRADEAALAAALEREARAQAVSYGAAELQEGLRAAREKRSAHFTP